jgi:regulator of sigma E protease
LINAIKIIFLLGFLIFIHEGGHFLAARLFKVKVEEFSIGFGPKIFSKKGKETNYSLSLIPFGGYVKMTGETERSNEKGAFNNAKVLHRIIIVAAGAFVNIVFGVIVYFILSFSSGYNVSTTVSSIIPEATSNLASTIEVGDKILEINNKKIRIKSDITKALEGSKGETLDVLVLRNNEKINLKVTPTEYSEDVYILGIKVAISDGTLKDKLYYSFWETIDFTASIGDSLVMLVSGKIGLEQMTGPIGISEVVANSSGVYDFVYLLCLVSLSLGVTNLLPIPALDGGRIVLLIIEGIRGKALKEEIELGIQSIGFALLILFSLYVSYNDILRIF